MDACRFLDSTIDYLAQYRLVDRSRLEMYGRAFTLEDEDEDGIISYEVIWYNYVYTRRDDENEVTVDGKQNKATSLYHGVKQRQTWERFRSRYAIWSLSIDFCVTQIHIC